MMIWGSLFISFFLAEMIQCVDERNMNDSFVTEYETTRLLNSLLDGYDKRFHPGFYHIGERQPTEVSVNINIRSMGPISEVDMAYQLDCYFRQTWTDERLRFNGKDTLRVSINFLDRLWKPDTHFYNGQQSYLHTVTTPNKLLRIEPTGSILYSMRLTIKASCPMHLETFPMDTQLCPLKFGSLGYGVNDVVYKWTHGADKSINTAADMTLSQFDLIGIPAGSSNETFAQKDPLSTLWANFKLRRHMGYFLINVYVPCSLLVIISWVGFWINREATSDRIALGVTTVLTMAFLVIDNRHGMPKVSYSTALDYFVGICFGFVLASVLQFASVHFFTKHDSGEIPVHSDSEEDDEDDYINENYNDNGWEYVEEDIDNKNNMQNTQTQYTNVELNTSSNRPWTGYACRNNGLSQRYSSCRSHSVRSRQTVTPAKKENKCCWQFYHCLVGNHKYRQARQREAKQYTTVNSVSKVDMSARLLFPLAFAIFNGVYWSFYLQLAS